jgi:hypothetical protein
MAQLGKIRCQNFLPNYNVSLDVFSKDPSYPCDMIKSTPNFEVECNKGIIKAVTVKNIVADNPQSAIQIAATRLGAVMGFFTLKTGRVLEHNGSRRVLTVDAQGKASVVSSCKKSDGFPNRVSGPPVNVDLFKFGAGRIRDPKTESVLNLYYLASSLNNNQNLSAAFLNLFTALEILVDGNGLSPDQLKFKQIRHSIVYADSGDKEARNFLMTEFGTHHPEWQTIESQAKLLKWYSMLENEIVQLLNTKLE